MEAALVLECAGEGPVRCTASRVEVGRRGDSVAYALGDAELVHLDFALKALRRYQRAEGTVVQRSLHAGVDFAGNEVLNRLMLRDILVAGEAAEKDRVDFEQVMVETQLGALARGKPPTTLGPAAPRRSRLGAFFRGPGPDIEAAPEGGGTGFTARGQRLAWCSDRGRASAHLPAYLHFLRQEVAVHPLVLDWVKARGLVPEEAAYGGGSVLQPSRVVVRLGEGAGADLEAPQGFRAVTGLDGSQQVDALLAEPPPPPTLPTWARLGESRTLLSGADPLGGLLVFLELTLEGPVPGLPPELNELRRQSADPRLRTLEQLLLASPPTAEAARAALARFAELRASKPAAVHVLGTFQASLHSSLGEDAQAKALLEEALLVNPRLAGAWGDLGHLYRRAYEQPRCWACWGRARELSPDHALVQRLVALEQRLEAEHPEWFSLV